MSERVYPSVKPSAGDGGPTAASPATKAQLYNASRPAYRPKPPPRRRCRCCLITVLILSLLLILTALTAGVLYFVYRPHRPTFSLSSLQISQFNLSSSSLSSTISLSITAKNPSRKVAFLYGPTAVAVYAAGTPAGTGEYAAFALPAKNTTVLKTVITANGEKVDATSSLGSDIKSKKSFDLEVVMDTKVRVKIGGMKTKSVKVRITCDGIKAAAPAGKGNATTTATGKGKCKVDLRVKIWKWTF